MSDLDFQGYYSDALGLFGGNVSYFRLALLGLVVWLGWGHWTNIFAAVKKFVVRLIADLKSVTPVPTVDPTIATAGGDPLPSLQAMTTWAVHNSTPEVLGKITALYQDLQAAGKGSK